MAVPARSWNAPPLHRLRANLIDLPEAADPRYVAARKRGIRHKSAETLITASKTQENPNILRCNAQGWKFSFRLDAPCDARRRPPGGDALTPAEWTEPTRRSLRPS